MVWRKNVKKIKNTLTLKINLSHAICNSKNEDTFLSCHLYVKFFFPTFLLSHHRTQSNFYLSTTHIYIHNISFNIYNYNIRIITMHNYNIRIKTHIVCYNYIMIMKNGEKNRWPCTQNDFPVHILVGTMYSSFPLNLISQGSACWGHPSPTNTRLPLICPSNLPRPICSVHPTQKSRAQPWQQQHKLFEECAHHSPVFVQSLDADSLKT